MIYFSSDFHLSHANIIKYSARPFKDAVEMDQIILRNFSTIQPDDLLYFLGDFTMRGEDHYKWFEKTIVKIPGRKILILGNHDKLNPFKYVEFGFESVHTSLIVDKYFLAHDPALLSAMPKEYIMLCGHVHELFKTQKDKQGRFVINVGVDVWDFKPASLKEIEDLK